MKKLIAATILCLSALNTFAQNTTTIPSPTTSVTLSTRIYGNITDSLRRFWFNTPGGGWNEFYSATVANQRFARISSLSGKADSTRLYGTVLPTYGTITYNDARYAKLFGGNTINQTQTFTGQAKYSVAKSLSSLDFLYKQKADSLYAPISAGADSSIYTTLNRYKYGLDTLYNKNTYSFHLLGINNVSVPTPANGVNIFGDAFANTFGYKGANGNAVLLSNSLLTGTRLLRWPDVTSKTIATIDGGQTFSSANMGANIVYRTPTGTAGTDSLVVKIGSTGKIGAVVYPTIPTATDYIENKYSSNTAQSNSKVHLSDSLITDGVVKGVHFRGDSIMINDKGNSAQLNNQYFFRVGNLKNVYPTEANTKLLLGRLQGATNGAKNEVRAYNLSSDGAFAVLGGYENNQTTHGQIAIGDRHYLTSPHYFGFYSDGLKQIWAFGNNYSNQFNDANYPSTTTNIMSADSAGNVIMLQPAASLTTYQAKYNAAKPLSSLDFVYKQKADSLYLPTAGVGTTNNSLTFNNGGAGDASGSTFNGSAAKTISYNSIGAAPLATTPQVKAYANLTGQTSTGTIVTHTVGASDGTFKIDPYFIVTTTLVPVTTLRMQVVFTDPNNVTSTQTAFANMATAVGYMGVASGGNLGGSYLFPPIRAKAGTTITVSIANALTSGVFDVGATITQIN